jgi:hypothetical protein
MTRPQEVVLDDEDDVVINGDDLVEFLSQGGTLWVLNGSRCEISDTPALQTIRIDEWEQIRRSCRTACHRTRPMNVLRHSILVWSSPEEETP